MRTERSDALESDHEDESGGYPGLTRIERLNVRAVEAWHSVPLLSAFSRAVGRQFCRRGFELVLGNMLRDHHFDRLAKADWSRGVLICANHRSYVDNFAIATRAMRHMPKDVRIVAPARTEGIFDRSYGLLLNFVLAGMNIYPPVVRSRRGVRWGQRVVHVVTALLQRGSVLVFIHPEGGRNKGSDPYRLLPARPGLGKMIHQSRAQVFPVFLHGFPRAPGKFIRANYRRGRRANPLVHAVMGEPLDFSAERGRPASPRLFSEIAERVNEAIRAAAEEERRLRGDGSGLRLQPEQAGTSARDPLWTQPTAPSIFIERQQ